MPAADLLLVLLVAAAGSGLLAERGGRPAVPAADLLLVLLVAAAGAGLLAERGGRAAVPAADLLLVLLVAAAGPACSLNAAVAPPSPPPTCCSFCWVVIACSPLNGLRRVVVTCSEARAGLQIHGTALNPGR